MAWYRDYRCKNWTMFKDYENNIRYGIAEDKTWVEPQPIKFPKANSEYLASEEEIEKALRKEAKRRGFVEGVKFLGCCGSQKDQNLTINDIKFKNDEGGCGLHVLNSWIFLRGEWGTVVKSLDLEYDANFFAFNNYERFTENQIDITIYEAIPGVPYTINDNITNWSGNSVVWKGSQQNLEYCILKTYFYHKSEEHGANFYELVKEIQTKVNDEWKTFVIYKQLGSGLEFSREKEEFYNKFKPVYV